jgi:hypothetical protein
LCFEVGYIGSWSNGRLWDILHIFFGGVHVVDATFWHAVTVLCEVAWFSTVETRAFESRAAWFFLGLRGCCIGICVVTLILLAIVGCSGSGQVHWDLYVIIRWSWHIGGVIDWSLLLLLLLLSAWLVLLAVSPCSRLKLVSVLAECVIEWLGVQEPPSCSDQFYHLLSFCDLDSLGFVFSIHGQEWNSYDFIQDTWGEAVDKEPNSFLIANGVSCLSH